MTAYRKASAINLVVGAASVVFGIVGIINLAIASLYSSNLFWALIFLLVFVLVGGYEAGKYAEMRHEQQKRQTQVP
jgi:uncharacterized membrane protein